MITLNDFILLGLTAAIFFVFGWFMREIVYNSVRDATPKRKPRVKKIKEPTKEDNGV